MATDDVPAAPSVKARQLSLTIILWAAVVDAVFLVALLVVLAAGASGAIRPVATLFVFGWVYLLYLAAKGAMDKRWGWWYFALVVVTLGPPGAIAGALRMQREIPAPPPAPPAGRPTRKEQRRRAAEERRAGR